MERRIALGGALVLATFIWVFATTHKARAHDPQTHQADSLSEAKSDAYGVCCDGKDYLRVTDWETTDKGFRVYAHGKWYEASRSVKVSNMQNPDGEAKVWINGPVEAQYIRCFMPGTLG